MAGRKQDDLEEWISSAIVPYRRGSGNGDRRTEEFYRLVYQALGLPHVRGAEASGAYHHLGTFRPAEADAAVDAAVAWYRRVTPEKINLFTFPEYDHACGRIDTIKSQIDRYNLWVEKDKEVDRQHALRVKHWKRQENGGARPQRPLHPRPSTLATPAEERFATRFRRHTYTRDRAGYLTYLADEAPHLRELLEQELPALLPEKDRRRHTYVVSTTGAGKSELLKLLIHSYVTKPTAAVLVIDPANDFAEQVARWKDHLKGDRLVYLDPYLIPGHTLTLNPLELKHPTEQDKDIAAQEIVDAFQELIAGSVGGELSLNMQVLLIPCIVTLFDLPGATLADLQRFMDDKNNTDLVERGRRSRREATRRFFETRFLDARYGVTKHSIYTKLQSLFDKQAFYNLVCGESTIDLEEAIARRKIIVCNLAKGKLGRAASEAFGRFLIAAVQSIAQRRADLPKKKRVPTHLFIDEAQNYISRSTITLLRESRKFALYGTLCQPGTGLEMSPQVRDQVLNLTNVKVVGRTPEPKEQRYWGDLLGVEPGEIGRLRTGEFYVRSGESATFKLRTATHLLDTANRMTAASWRRTIRKQQRAYYRSIEVSEPQDAASPDAAPEPSEETRQNAPRGRRRRELI